MEEDGGGDKVAREEEWRWRVRRKGAGGRDGVEPDPAHARVHQQRHDVVAPSRRSRGQPGVLQARQHQPAVADLVAWSTGPPR